MTNRGWTDYRPEKREAAGGLVPKTGKCDTNWLPGERLVSPVKPKSLSEEYAESMVGHLKKTDGSHIGEDPDRDKITLPPDYTNTTGAGEFSPTVPRWPDAPPISPFIQKFCVGCGLTEYHEPSVRERFDRKFRCNSCERDNQQILSTSVPAPIQVTPVNVPDPINPSHYTNHPSGVDCADVTEHFSFCIGNVIKYVWRAGLKSREVLEDLRKARWYLDREIARLEKAAKK